ncbi:sodium-dependent proline transporter-like [Haliotis rufescens]|uniref:sodium-dependent proline transporter-like n=1 Tax=Haliotis rufescens TaxID=6454 RepID=UPI001EAFDEC5|nr:sodium-dependent proline transporter-like [Haliotis rufescens]XP_048251094.1 sodium-dependent proline transporter-like [Haliotis rufescens]XP_048251095.1 sodium-dependent proline transporter-like [Haliotis rufescens]XP_048251096.1 sodium-dependent proline transporter-like [Haliotis rufescens]XP_048251097.1 sodium-dependent proline transporter-like [Haliotis rufescens]XP_048251098.1 sodium-dependent proline transporter-like [Haliotis rufescens]XP_048251099.1 sodium-dependent proline transpo
MGEIAPWNPMQFIFISFFTCYLSFMRPPEGGMSVIALYLLTFFICTPALYIQLKLGGYLQKGIVGIFSMFFPIWKGVGVVAVIDLLLRLTNLAPIVAQFGTYAFIAISEQPYVWGNCKTIIDQPFCYDGHSEVKILNNMKSYHRAEELFYKHEFLQISTGVDSMDGFPQWKFTEIARKAEVSLMPVTLAIVWVIIFLLVGFGGRFCGWVLFVMGPAALSCLLAVLGYGYTHLDRSAALAYLKQVYAYNSEYSALRSWHQSLLVVMNSLPVWTVIAATMGKMCGKGRSIRNITWVLMIGVYALFSQLPPIAMAPYLGDMIFKQQSPGMQKEVGPGLVLWQMPAAFTALNIPPIYAFLFLLSAFLFGLMFLVVGSLTIVDNIMDSLEEWIDKKCCSKIVIHLLMTFVIMCVAKGMGILQTTKAGMYYFILIDQSISKLQFILVILLAFGLLVVYIKQNFALAERIIMGLWFIVSAVFTAGMWFTLFLKTRDRDLIYEEDNYTFPEPWKIVSWCIAVLPYIGILLGALHTLFTTHGPGFFTKCCCGVTERVREHEDTEHEETLMAYHPPPPEPTAPPYMQTYMEHSYPMDDLGYNPKYDYDPPETEPLTASNHCTRI